MTNRQLGAALLTITLVLGTAGFAEENKEAAKQTTCPVMGGKINPAQYVDVKGYRIYVCCPGCKGKVKSDPDKYIKQMEAEGITLEKAPAKEEHQKGSGK